MRKRTRLMPGLAVPERLTRKRPLRSSVVLVGKREKIGQDQYPRIGASRLRRVLQVRLKGKGHERTGRANGQPCMTGSHTARLAVSPVARAVEAADFSEALQISGEIGQEHLDRPGALGCIRYIARETGESGVELLPRRGRR